MSFDTSTSVASEVASALSGLLDERIVIADVGCRWGFADTWEQLGGRCRAIGFEPDERECERLRKRYHDRPWVEIVAHALGREAGPATLYVTREPACSSPWTTGARAAASTALTRSRSIRRARSSTCFGAQFDHWTTSSRCRRRSSSTGCTRDSRCSGISIGSSATTASC